MYYWRNVLRREGHWPEEPGEAQQRSAVAPGSARAPMRFARVTFEKASGSSPITVRVMLENGRRVEIELADTQRLREVLSAVESAA